VFWPNNLSLSKNPRGGSRRAHTALFVPPVRTFSLIIARASGRISWDEIWDLEIDCGKGYSTSFIFAIGRECTRDFLRSQLLVVVSGPAYLDLSYDVTFSYVRLLWITMVVCYVGFAMSEDLCFHWWSILYLFDDDRGTWYPSRF